jgi:hypothetical protein
VAIFHCNISVASRADGASAVAGAAYISRSAIEFEREGTVFDFTKAHRHERLVADLGIALPDNAPKRLGERGALWNEVERVEKRDDAQLCRRIEWALPDELPYEEKVKLARRHVGQRVAAGHVVDACIHCNVDGTNWHVHELEPLRPVGEDGLLAKSENVYLCRRASGEEMKANAREFAALRDEGWEKVYRYRSGHDDRWLTPTEAAAWARDVLGHDAKPEDVSEWVRRSRLGRSPKQETRYLTDWNDPGKAEEWRSEIAALINDALEANGLDGRVDHRSYERQGVDRVPQVHEGSRVRAIERRAMGAARAAGTKYEPVTARAAENAERRAAGERMADASAALVSVTSDLVAALVENLRGLCLLAAERARSFRDFRSLLERFRAPTEWRRGTLIVTDADAPEAQAPVGSLDPELAAYLADHAEEAEDDRVSCVRDEYLAYVRSREAAYRREVVAMANAGGYRLVEMPKLKIRRPPEEIRDDPKVQQAIVAAWQRADIERRAHASDRRRHDPHRYDQPTGGGGECQRRTEPQRDSRGRDAGIGER